MQAMIFAAGLGTRLKPLTDTMPKALVKVGGKPLIEHVILNLKAAGAEKIVVNVHHFAGQIVDFLTSNNNFGIDIRISDESSMLLETGGGIKRAAPLFSSDKPILIHNVDILSNVDLRKFYESNLDNDATLLVSGRVTKRYLLFDDKMSLKGWTNTSTGEVKMKNGAALFDNGSSFNKFAFSGIHIFTPRLFPLFADYPDKFGIMDFYLGTGGDVDIKGYLKNDLQLMDVGKLDTLNEAEDFLQNLHHSKN